MSEIKSLLERADRYLQSAKLLIEAQDYESAVSRTYYAMFYSAQATLLTKGLSASSHGGVLTVFSREFIKPSILPKSLGREFNRAFQKRQIGDYTHSFSISKEESEQLLESGRTFVSAIERYLKQESFL